MYRLGPGFILDKKKKKDFLSLVDHWYLRIVFSANYPTGPIKNPLCIVNSKSNFKQYVIKSLSNKLDNCWDWLKLDWVQKLLKSHSVLHSS